MRVNFFLFAALTGLTFVGCGNKVNFSSQQPAETPFAANPITQPNDPDVPNEPIVEPPPDEPQPTLSLKNGTCAVGVNEKVLSCLDCESTAPVPPPPLLSRKGQELLDIMTAACSIPNKSDPQGYVPPTKADLLKRVIQCSPTAYQDTAFVNTQATTIYKLLNDYAAQKKAFGGLYYNSATTDFETYFGLDIGEARYTFCRGQRTFNSGGVYPKEYYDSLYSGRPYTLPPYYVAAQRIRNQLRNCLAESLRNPNRPGQPGTPGVICSYESAEGEMSPLVVDKVYEWQNQGHEVYYEGFGQCGIIDQPSQFLDNAGNIKIAIKKCQ